MIELSEEIKKALEVMEYHSLLPIQEKVIPHLLNDEDVIVKAKTGSGKTAAFAIPLCENMVWDEKAPQALILACTRELVMQIAQETSEIGRFKKIKVASIIGKENMQYQKSELAQKCHIVVATPGRLYDHIEQGSVDLSKIRYVVIDEADYMLDLGFIEHVNAILETIPTEYTKALFSATFPDKMRGLLAKMNKDAQVIKIEDMASITQEALCCEDKWESLQFILKSVPIESAIVFCNQQVQVDELYAQLKSIKVGCVRLHGGMRQKDRIQELEAFRKGDSRILIASDVAARGIDIKKVSHVIHYDMPKTRNDFVHRCGRSGRNEESGCSILLYTKKEQNEYCERLFEQFDIQEMEKGKAHINVAKLNEKANKKDRNDNWKDAICTLYFSLGKEKKIRVVDIVGSLCSIDGIGQEDIGVIRVLDKFSYVEVLNHKENIILKAFENKKIKNKNVKVEIAK